MRSSKLELDTACQLVRDVVTHFSSSGPMAVLAFAMQRDDLEPEYLKPFWVKLRRRYGRIRAKLQTRSGGGQ